jgi:hypothetical protein
MKKDMIQGLAPHFGCPDEDPQVFDQLGLAGKFFDGRRANIILKFFVCGSQSAFIIAEIEIRIGHVAKISYWRQTVRQRTVNPLQNDDICY